MRLAELQSLGYVYLRPVTARRPPSQFGCRACVTIPPCGRGRDDACACRGVAARYNAANHKNNVREPTMTAIRGYVAPTTESGALGVHSLDQFVLAVPDAAVAQDFYGTFGLDVQAKATRSN